MTTKIVKKMILVGLMLSAVALVRPAAPLLPLDITTLNISEVDFNNLPSNIQQEMVDALLQLNRASVDNAFEYAATHGLLWAIQPLIERGGAYEGIKWLKIAAENGNIAMATLLLEKEGIEIDNADCYGNTALSLASKNGDSGIVKLLLAKGANVACCGGAKALRLAVENRDTTVMNLLLDGGHYGKYIDDADCYGNTALSLASENGDSGIVKLLLAKGANVACCGGAKALRLAVENRDTVVMNLLLNGGHYGKYIDDADCYDHTALSLASENGDSETVKLLLAKGANVACWKGAKALRLAVKNRDTAVMNLLLNGGHYGKHIDDADCYDSTALSLASENGDSETVKLLLAQGADVACCKGAKALRLAVKNGHTAVVNLLLHGGEYGNGGHYGKHIDDADCYGNTALSLASENGDSETVALLLEKGAGKSARALRGAAEKGNELVAKLMVDGLKSFDSDDSKKALEIAIEKNHITITKSFIDAYRRHVMIGCPAMRGLILKDSNILTQTLEGLSLECGQIIAEYLSKRDILSWRCVSNNCLSYAQYRFERIKKEEEKEKLSRYINPILKKIGEDKISSAMVQLLANEAII